MFRPPHFGLRRGSAQDFACCFPGRLGIPEGPCTQELGTWVWSTSNYGIGCGAVYEY